MRFKKIDPKQRVYHHFELSPSSFAMYDADFEEPVVQGSRNLVDGTIRNLPKHVTIIYYKLDVDKVSFKAKIKYTGDKFKPI